MPGPWKQRPNLTLHSELDGDEGSKENKKHMLNWKGGLEARPHGNACEARKRKGDDIDGNYAREDYRHWSAIGKKVKKNRDRLDDFSSVRDDGTSTLGAVSERFKPPGTAADFRNSMPKSAFRSELDDAKTLRGHVLHRKRKRQYSEDACSSLSQHESSITILKRAIVTFADTVSSGDAVWARSEAPDGLQIAVTQTDIDLPHRTMPSPKRSKIRGSSAPVAKKARVHFHGNDEDARSVVAETVAIASRRSLPKQLWIEKPFMPLVDCDLCSKRVEQFGGRKLGEPDRLFFAQSLFACAKCNAILEGRVHGDWADELRETWKSVNIV
eukprot:TRINITY_DN6987_c0_g1_i2.p1 TRINITY_DN6987_c0_g1~~TRINITY_DN6987_c0_g1_i2.p1  ORF type:complete len:343 (-),score=28.11 TRINITY_DN6987_c0_g1_i2:602-1582(-)